MTNEPFNEESLIYTYSRDLFRETVQGLSERDVWVGIPKGKSANISWQGMV